MSAFNDDLGPPFTTEKSTYVAVSRFKVYDSEEAFETVELSMKYKLFVPNTSEPGHRCPLVILVHGFQGKKSYHYGTGCLLAERGIATICPDMGSLVSSTRRGLRKKQLANIYAIIEMYKWMQERTATEGDSVYLKLDPTRFALSGHSAGGAIVYEACTILQQMYQGSLSSPALEPPLETPSLVQTVNVVDDAAAVPAPKSQTDMAAAAALADEKPKPADPTLEPASAPSPQVLPILSHISSPPAALLLLDAVPWPDTIDRAENYPLALRPLNPHARSSMDPSALEEALQVNYDPLPGGVVLCSLRGVSSMYNKYNYLEKLTSKIAPPRTGISSDPKEPLRTMTARGNALFQDIFVLNALHGDFLYQTGQGNKTFFRRLNKATGLMGSKETQENIQELSCLFLANALEVNSTGNFISLLRSFMLIQKLKCIAHAVTE